MKNKFIAVSICIIFIGAIFTTTASSLNFEDNKEIHTPENEDNWEEPIEAIVVTEKIDGRTWKIKVYAHNTYDEEITIKTGPYFPGTFIQFEGSNEKTVYRRERPSYGWWIWYMPDFIKYSQKRTFQANEEILIDEFTFDGKSSLTLYERFILRIIGEWAPPIILPEGDYYIFARLMYQYEGLLKNAFSEDVIIPLEAPQKSINLS